jgi:hypothetical protein
VQLQRYASPQNLVILIDYDDAEDGSHPDTKDSVIVIAGEDISDVLQGFEWHICLVDHG